MRHQLPPSTALVVSVFVALSAPFARGARAEHGRPTPAPSQPFAVYHSLLGKSGAAVGQIMGLPEDVSPPQKIYDLRQQPSVRWYFYRKRGVALALDRSDHVTALLYLSLFRGVLEPGLKLGMSQSESELRLGRAPYQENGAKDASRLIYPKWGYDLTFDASHRLVQILHYPQLSRMTGSSPTPKASPSHTPPTPASTASVVTVRPSVSAQTVKASPRITSTVVTPTPTALRIPHARTGKASLSGLVSYFEPRSGAVNYLEGVQFYLSADPLDESLEQSNFRMSQANARSVRARYRKRIWSLIREGLIIAGCESDRAGRFMLESLPAGRYFLVGLADDPERFLVWHERITLPDGYHCRRYLNRNNLALTVDGT